MATDNPTTEELTTPDGVLDEKAASETIEKVMKEERDEMAEATAAKDTTAAEDKVPAKEDAAVDEESDGDDWVTSEDIAELIESLGYSEEDMAEFAGPVEFQTHVRLLDRELKRVRPGDEQERALEADELSRQKDARTAQVKEQYREDGKFAKAPEELPKLDPDEFDERLIEAMEARDARIAALEAQINDSGQKAILQDFDNIVDGLGFDDLFGKSEDLKPAERKERARLFEEYKEIFNIQEARGKPVSGKGTNRALVLRALNLEFADEIKKQNRRELTSKIKKQSARKTGSGHRQATKQYDGPIEKHPELIERFKQLESENG